jgi:hypothetical protein
MNFLVAISAIFIATLSVDALPAPQRASIADSAFNIGGLNPSGFHTTTTRTTGAVSVGQVSQGGSALFGGLSGSGATLSSFGTCL